MHKHFGELEDNRALLFLDDSGTQQNETLAPFFLPVCMGSSFCRTKSSRRRRNAVTTTELVRDNSQISHICICEKLCVYYVCGSVATAPALS